MTQLRPRYVELLGDAIKVEPSPTDYLADIDPGYYVISYLRAWAFSADDHVPARAVRQRLVPQARGRPAPDRAVGARPKPTADELLKDVTGAAVELEAVAEHVRDAIPTPA